MLNQWHGRIVWFPLDLTWATVLWLFGCLASLDGPLVTNSLFLRLVWAISSWALLESSLPSRVEREETLNTPLWGGLADMAHTCNPCLSWYHDSSWHPDAILFLPSTVRSSCVTTRNSNFQQLAKDKKLNQNQWEIHLTEFKFCEDSRSEPQLQKAKAQHSAKQARI